MSRPLFMVEYEGPFYRDDDGRMVLTAPGAKLIEAVDPELRARIAKTIAEGKHGPMRTNVWRRAVGASEVLDYFERADAVLAALGLAVREGQDQ